MNWDAVAAISEAVGVIAVLASILYLARQVAQGNRLNQSDSIRTFLGQFNGFLNQIGDEDFIEIWRRGTADFNALNDHEKSRLHTKLLEHFMLGQTQRMIDPGGNEELSQFADFAFAQTVKQPGARQWWDTFKTGIPDREYVSRIDNFPDELLPKWNQFMPWYVPDRD